MSSPVPPPRKKTSPLVWILAGVAIFFVLIVGLIVAGGLFVVHKAKQAGFDPELMQKQPGVAMAKMLAAANPDVDIVKIDENKGVVTFREKSSGKTVTVDFRDIEQGRISFESEEGKASFGGAGSDVKLPGWLAAYPDSTPSVTFSARTDSSDAGAFHFETDDSPVEVLEFYESALKKRGLKVTIVKGDQGGIVTGEDEGAERKAFVNVSTDDGRTRVMVTFESK